MLLTVRPIQLLMIGVTLLLSQIGAQANPILWSASYGGNGHYYDVIDSGYLDWPIAEANADSASFMGVRGHLATVTSQAENNFLLTTFGAARLTSKWLGGFRLVITGTPSEGWGWITGEPWNYTNWAHNPPDGGREPNNAHELETALQIAFNGVPAEWNDLRPVGDGRSNGYLIEYDAVVPEPRSTVLLGCGLAVIGIASIRRRTVSRSGAAWGSAT